MQQLRIRFSDAGSVPKMGIELARPALLRLEQHPLLCMVNTPLLASIIGQDHGKNGPANRGRTAVLRIVINPEVGRENRRNHSAR
jgi:hypothetical protein